MIRHVSSISSWDPRARSGRGHTGQRSRQAGHPPAPAIPTRRRGLACQLHLDLLASVKLLTELSTLAALVAIAATWVAEGLDGSALTAVWSASTDVLTAMVWSGSRSWPSCTTEFASLTIVLICDFRPLTPLLVADARQILDRVLEVGAVSAVRRLAAAAATGERDQRRRRQRSASAVRIAAQPHRTRLDLSTFFLSSMAAGYGRGASAAHRPKRLR